MARGLRCGGEWGKDRDLFVLQERSSNCEYIDRSRAVVV